MEDDSSPAALHPTAGYLFAEELDVHFPPFDDFHSMFLQDSAVPSKLATTAIRYSYNQPTLSSSPGSPSSVIHLPPFYSPTYPFNDIELMKPEGTFTAALYQKDVSIKSEPVNEFTYGIMPYHSANSSTLSASIRNDTTCEQDKERLRRRQRGYEKRYRGRKRRDLKMQRDLWLALEMKLDATRKKYCRPYVYTKSEYGNSLRHKLRLLKMEERALLNDQIAMRSLQSWEEISRIREYSDKDQLRTPSEWRHSADKVIGRCALIGPRRFHPYAPIEQPYFMW